MRRTIRSILCSISLLALVPFLASAQVATGAPPLGSFGGGPDIINLANLNAHITVPVLHKPGRGTNFTYDLSYDTSVWFPVGTSGNQTWQHSSTWGFTKGDQFGYVTFTERDTTCGTNHAFQAIFSNWTYIDSSGTPHRFGFSTRGPSVSPCIATTETGTSADGSGYTMNATADQINYVITPDGAVIHPSTIPGGGGTIQDRNGNLLSGSGSPLTYTDTLGTSALSVVGTAPSNTTFTYTAPNGQPASYTMSYVTRTVKTNFGCSGVAEYGPTSISLVDRITLPDGSFYQFNYEPTPGFSGDYTARLASVTLPTGGTITYTYSAGSSGHITCSDGSAAGLTRQTPDGTWTYARTMGSGAASTTTITDPQGNVTQIQFQGIYETQRSVYVGAIAQIDLLHTWNTCYNGAVSPCNGTAVTLPITLRTVTDQDGPSGIQCKHVYDYNAFGLLTEQDDYDYASGTPTTILRKEIIAYASLGNNIVNQPSSISIQNGSGTPVAQTTFCYDEGTPWWHNVCCRGITHRNFWHASARRRLRLARQRHDYRSTRSGIDRPRPKDHLL